MQKTSLTEQDYGHTDIAVHNMKNIQNLRKIYGSMCSLTRF